MKFDTFKFDTDFTKDSFDMEKNMASGKSAESTVAEVDENGNPITAPEGQEPAEQPVAAELGDFGIIEPDYIPAGVEFKDSHKLEGTKTMLFSSDMMGFISTLLWNPVHWTVR